MLRRTSILACACLLGGAMALPATAQQPKPKAVTTEAIVVEAPITRSSQSGKQAMELRTYTLVDEQAEAKLDEYLASALVPALQRQGLGPIGTFGQAKTAGEGGDDQEQAIEVMLLIPGPDVEAVTSASAKLASDQQYQRAAKSYLETPANDPVVKRIRSELLLAFDCWPEVAVPEQKQRDESRLFELRTYESPTEHLGALKVEMFNAGEVPIFLDSGIKPVFMGQALIGDMMPNLTYMTVYDDDHARQTGWKNFREHADWKVLSSEEKYKGTVSKIHKSDWRPKSYSQL